MKRIFTLLLFSLSILTISCRKQHRDCNHHCTENTGIVRDLTGKSGGCGIVIELADGSRLEPISSPAGFTYTDGKKVEFCYEVQAAGSICMAGETVAIKKIHYIP